MNSLRHIRDPCYFNVLALLRWWLLIVVRLSTKGIVLVSGLEEICAPIGEVFHQAN